MLRRLALPMNNWMRKKSSSAVNFHKILIQIYFLEFFNKKYYSITPLEKLKTTDLVRQPQSQSPLQLLSGGETSQNLLQIYLLAEKSRKHLQYKK
jgi:hypothetical protein